MESRSGRLRLEAEDVAVGDMVGDGEEVAVEGLDVLEFEVLAPGEMSDGLGDVAAQGIACGDFREHGKA